MDSVKALIGFGFLDIWCGKLINVFCFRTKEK